MSDEGDPWCVFINEQSGEPIYQLARIDGHYIIGSPDGTVVLRNNDVTQIMNTIVLSENFMLLLKRAPLSSTALLLSFFVAANADASMSLMGDDVTPCTHAKINHLDVVNSCNLLDRLDPAPILFANSNLPPAAIFASAAKSNPLPGLRPADRDPAIIVNGELAVQAFGEADVSVAHAASARLNPGHVAVPVLGLAPDVSGNWASLG
ncbi:hypothetical protein KTR66_23745 [Roseococcus sp. SDR]|uniref:hypothetical protein n=1 Tax=Roseococcus sp. SDR TaxID=2835532 RepID=UPI001BCC457A|nr:hypothetical protein [Roseococcus sp. SDR]MBS7793016.1 hypothetical protein [Roseococcus sp. SDR]MBV1848330.1 hypothetical protein [Roseococcus sp. SDR]